MRLAISNIAWAAEEEEQVPELLGGLGLTAVEVAPTKAWADPVSAGASDIASYRRWWAERGFEIAALQSLNYARPDFELFGTPAQRAEMLHYLQSIIRLGGALGARVLVFGSPKNRLTNSRPKDEVDDIAAKFFQALGATAADVGVCLCIEPNPTAYGCDFVTTAAEGVRLVRLVNHPGFGLHLDAAGLTLAGDDPAGAVLLASDVLKHFHVSAPYLEEVGAGSVDHRALASALRESGYQGKVSIEMKPGAAGTNLPRVSRAVAYANAIYGN